MSEGHSGSLLAPLIFIICLAILPGAGGFFLAIFVLIAINVIVNERLHLAEKSLRKVASIAGSKVEVESEEDVRDVSVRSIETIKERTRSYTELETRIVRNATPSAQAALIDALGNAVYLQMVNSLIEEKPKPWEPAPPHGPELPGNGVPPEHVEHPPEEAPHFEGPGL
jgi:hypothetical protein